jgi:tripartite ATP-independent transporter DctP family solute receptor
MTSGIDPPSIASSNAKARFSSVKARFSRRAHGCRAGLKFAFKAMPRGLVFLMKAGNKPAPIRRMDLVPVPPSAGMPTIRTIWEMEMGFSRRAVLKASAASAVMGSVGAPFIARAEQAEFTYKFANNLPDTHPLNIRAREMAAAIKTETNGRFELQIFPNNQLGADTDVLSQLRSGGVEFFTMSGLILAILVPAASINGMGFAFPDYPTVWKAMDGDLGAFVRREVAKANIIAFEKIWDNGFRQTTSSTRPINGPEDYKGFKIRVPVSPLWTSMFKAFDAAPASINFNEVYSALQTRIVEGQENPLALISTAKLYEVQKYCSLTNHMWDGYWFLANRRALEALPAEVRTVVEKNVNAAALKARADTEKLNATVREELAGKGLIFNQPDLAPFREKLRSAGFYSEWKGKYGEEAWSILEKSVGKLS